MEAVELLRNFVTGSVFVWAALGWVALGDRPFGEKVASGIGGALTGAVYGLVGGGIGVYGGIAAGKAIATGVYGAQAAATGAAWGGPVGLVLVVLFTLYSLANAAQNGSPAIVRRESRYRGTLASDTHGRAQLLAAAVAMKIQELPAAHRQRVLGDAARAEDCAASGNATGGARCLQEGLRWAQAQSYDPYASDLAGIYSLLLATFCGAYSVSRL